MRALLIVPYYIHWHYSRALHGIIAIAGNIIWFIWNFFSIGILAKTLFAPWQRLQEAHHRGFDLGGYVSTMLLNTIMRFVGFLIRFIFIIIGLATIAFAFLATIGVFIVWLLLPVVVVVMFIFGIILLFRPS
jgi:hypothetical protein